MSDCLWCCNNCGWIGRDDALLRAPSPFDPDDVLAGCPACKQTAEGFKNICDEPGCTKEAGCGFPTADGYRRTCYDHSQFKPGEQRE